MQLTGAAILPPPPLILRSIAESAAAAQCHYHYKVAGALGAGGMATVYLAHHVWHDGKVGLKVLRPDLAAALGAEPCLAEQFVLRKRAPLRQYRVNLRAISAAS